MSKSKSNQHQTPPAKPPRRGNWLGLAVGGLACLGAVVYVTAEGLSGAMTTPPAAAEAASTATPAPSPAPAPKHDPAQIATLAQMTGQDLPTDVQTMLQGEAPEHLEYDAANNQHWWAPHNHWHPGPPPAAAAGAIAGLPAGATPVAAPPFDQNAPAIMPDGSVPGPWDYDPANNRHWHAGHNHWHQGPPPAEDQRQ